MVDTLLSSNFVPFSLALGLLFALLALEILSHLVGSSLFAADDGPDFDLDAASVDGGDFDFDPGADLDIDALPDPADLDAPAMPSGGGILDLLGLTGVPLLLWFAALLLTFGVSGLALQGLSDALFGAPLPGSVASIITLPIGILGARSFARAFSAVLPKTETTATRAQFFGGRRGTVTQGTARQGHPAEVRLHDRHGNVHYIRAEPFKATDTIPQGTDVILIRERRGPGDFILKLVPVPAD